MLPAVKVAGLCVFFTTTSGPLDSVTGVALGVSLLGEPFAGGVSPLLDASVATALAGAVGASGAVFATTAG